MSDDSETSPMEKEEDRIKASVANSTTGLGASEENDNKKQTSPTKLSKLSLDKTDLSTKKSISVSTSSDGIKPGRKRSSKTPRSSSNTKDRRSSLQKESDYGRSSGSIGRDDERRGSTDSNRRSSGREIRRSSSKGKKVSQKDSNYDYGKTESMTEPPEVPSGAESRDELKQDSEKNSVEQGRESVPATSVASLPVEAIKSNVSTRSVQADVTQEPPQHAPTAFSTMLHHSSSFATVITEDGVDEATLTEPFQNLDDHGYEAVKLVFDGVQQTLLNQQDEMVQLTPVIDEFASLWEGIDASHENEQRLVKRDRNISVKLSATMAKSRTLIKLAKDDLELAIKLGLRLEHAWAKVDEGDHQERENVDKIDLLKQEIFELNRNINSASKIEGQDTLRELLVLKNELEGQRDLLHTEATKYRSSLNIMYAKRQELFDKQTALEEKANLLMQEYEAQMEATERETTRKERLAVENVEIVDKIKEKLAQLDELDLNLHAASNKIIDTERAVRDQKLVNETILRETEFSSNRIEKLRQDYEAQQRLVERLTLEAYRQAQEVKSKEQEIFNLRLELHRAMRQRSLNMKKVVTLQQALSTLELEREGLKSRITMLEKELEIAQKKIEEKKKKVEQLDKERSFVNRNLKRAAAVTSEHSNQAKTHEVAVGNLEQALHMYSLEINEQRTTIFHLEEERDFYSHEATKLAQQVSYKLNDIKKMDLAILEQKRKLAGLENQVKKLQQVFELARYDKEVFERTLHDTVADIMENQTKLRIMSNQINSIKYQLNQKDELIHQEALRYDRILKETDFFKKESMRIQRLAEDIQRTSEALAIERSTLGCAVAEVEGELSKHMYYVNAALSRERLFQRKLMDQEKELRSAWEKWRVLESMIRIGASHYRRAIVDIRDLRFYIIAYRKAQAGKKGLGKNYSRMRREVAIMENSIAKERCMISALQEQMRHPINVHRWRLLEATSPEAYEMVLRINLLTRRLVGRNSNLAVQSKYLQEKQEIYVEARKALERCPGLETPEEVTYYQHLLFAKQQQFHHLKRELLAAESQTEFYRGEVLLLNDKMLELKQKFFEKLRGSYAGFKSNCIRVKTKPPERQHTELTYNDE
ncbi:unnamed protein product [Allacma fusca]|uniref:Cilia- and flagella-associated protein 58 central coiled coil domain-containing protein n=1 Tax=Allacma fusca TaxID=39272 RepID=A0A8J2LDN7_9HEXA|nr:unnamed protein product [Allacma fusca]